MSKKNISTPKLQLGNTNRLGEGHLYDKIMRENLLELFLPLVAAKLNFRVKKVTPLIDKQPTTILRETDSFLLIETYSETEPKFILHLEFESKDNEEMIYRIVEYHGIELRKYRLPIKHVVVYLGERKPKMRTTLAPEEVFKGFTLVNAQEFSPKEWLAKEEPAQIIMAVLGNYRKSNAVIILEAIFTKLRKVCKTDTELKKFIQQLIIISRMRNLEKLTLKISEQMPIYIDVEKDYLYKLGFQKAEALFADAEMKAQEAINKVKVKLEAKAKAEKAKAKAEKAKLEAKAKTEQVKKIALEAKVKNAIVKMQVAQFSDEVIADFLNLNKMELNRYLKEIKAEQNKG